MSANPGEPRIELIVEGKADKDAVPILLRKHLHEKEEFRDILGKPITLHGITNATKASGIEGFVATAAYRPGCRGILVVLDADDACVKDCVTDLVSRVEGKVQPPIVFAFAEKKYEDWLYASIETFDIGDAQFHPGTNGEKEIKTALRTIGESYSKPLWQPRLTHRLDLTLAKSRSPSLARMLDRFDAMLPLLDDPQLEIEL